MLKTLFSRQIDRFERDLNYDATYMRDLLDASPWKFFRFSFIPSLGRGTAAPAEALAAAGIFGTLSEDCGPCTQISVDLAARGGVRQRVQEVVRYVNVGALSSATVFL